MRHNSTSEAVHLAVGSGKLLHLGGFTLVDCWPISDLVVFQPSCDESFSSRSLPCLGRGRRGVAGFSSSLSTQPGDFKSVARFTFS